MKIVPVCAAFIGVLAVQVAAEDRLYAPMPVDQVKSKVLDWAAGRGIQDKALIEKVGKLWALGNEPRPAEELLERFIQTAGLVDPQIQQLAIAGESSPLTVIDSDLLRSDQLEPFLAQNLRAFVMRALAQRGLYDEALLITERVQPELLIDPASFLFFKAVCQQRLLMKKESLETLKELRHNTSGVPVRYSSIAELMEQDLQTLQEKSLNEVSRMMSDVERRLGLGRGGERVQKVEEEIISRLDDIIKKIEAQQSGGGGGGGQSGNQNQSSTPAQDSRVKGSTAPGEVDEHDIGRKSGWGALPPKEQAKAKNLIDRELPPHYRSAIEQYLKKLATRPAAPSDQRE